MPNLRLTDAELRHLLKTIDELLENRSLKAGHAAVLNSLFVKIMNKNNPIYAANHEHYIK